MSTLKSNEQNEKEIKTTPWTNEEKELLVKLYPEKSNSELCMISEYYKKWRILNNEI